jgi:hypothetical protein
VRLSKKRPVHGGEVRLGRKGPSSSMERWRQQDEGDNCRSMAWRRRRVPREQIMNGRKAQDHADIATPRQPAMDKRHSPFRRRRSTVGPTAERSGHMGYPTLSLSFSSLMGERDVLGDGSWQGREERACRRPVGDGVRNRALGRGDALRIRAHEDAPTCQHQVFAGRRLRLIGFVLNLWI